MLSKCIDVGRAKRAQPKHHASGYTPRPTKLLTASSFTPASFHLHSPWQRARVLLVAYSTAQRCSALPRNSSSEQERPVRSAVLIWSSSAGHTPQRPWPLRRRPTAWNDRARAQCSPYPCWPSVQPTTP